MGASQKLAQYCYNLAIVLIAACVIAAGQCAAARVLLLRQVEDKSEACPPAAKAVFDTVMNDPWHAAPVEAACNLSVVQPEDRCAGSCYCAVDSNIIRTVVHRPDFPSQILSNNVAVEACDYYLFSSLTTKQIVSIPVLMVSNDASCGIDPPQCSGQDTSGPHAVAASGPAQGK